MQSHRYTYVRVTYTRSFIRDAVYGGSGEAGATLTRVTACRKACWPSCWRWRLAASSTRRLSSSMRRRFSSSFSRMLFSCAAIAGPALSSVGDSPSAYMCIRILLRTQDVAEETRDVEMVVHSLLHTQTVCIRVHTRVQ